MSISLKKMYNSLMPVFFAERIPKVMAVFLFRMYAADGATIGFQTDQVHRVQGVWRCLYP